MIVIAQLVVEARTDSGLSQAQLAMRIGTTQSAVSRWERGHDEPRIRTLRDILTACGKRLVIEIEDDVDRSQIRQQLLLSPLDRLSSVINVSRTVASAHRA